MGVWSLVLCTHPPKTPGAGAQVSPYCVLSTVKGVLMGLRPLQVTSQLEIGRRVLTPHLTEVYRKISHPVLLLLMSM